MSDARASESAPREQQAHQVPPLMPEFAIVTTLLLIAAPVVLVGGTLLLAAKKTFSRRSPG